MAQKELRAQARDLLQQVPILVLSSTEQFEYITSF